LSAPRRSVELGWVDGVDMMQVLGDSPDPDYIKATSTGGALPVALRRDSPLLVQELTAALEGPNAMVCYLPEISKGTPDTVQTVVYSRSLYGRVVSPINLETVQGTEEEDEVVRLASLLIEQEV
jgi:hypothetical protein